MAIQHDVERDWVDADRDSVTLQVAEHGYIDKSKPALLAPAVMEQLGVDNGDTITVTGENAVETRVWRRSIRTMKETRSSTSERT
ncbi:MAG: hypothetical protein ABEI97_03485 [Candidatus Nanohaloarchaea archaeon]